MKNKLLCMFNKSSTTEWSKNHHKNLSWWQIVGHDKKIQFAER